MKFRSSATLIMEDDGVFAWMRDPARDVLSRLNETREVDRADCRGDPILEFDEMCVETPSEAPLHWRLRQSIWYQARKSSRRISGFTRASVAMGGRRPLRDEARFFTAHRDGLHNYASLNDFDHTRRRAASCDSCDARRPETALLYSGVQYCVSSAAVSTKPTRNITRKMKN